MKSIKLASIVFTLSFCLNLVAEKNLPYKRSRSAGTKPYLVEVEDTEDNNDVPDILRARNDSSAALKLHNRYKQQAMRGRGRVGKNKNGRMNNKNTKNNKNNKSNKNNRGNNKNTKKIESDQRKGVCSHTGMNWSQYQSTGTIHRFTNCLASQYKDRATLFNIGRTTEGSDIKLLQIGTGGRGKPAIFIDGGIHAREWISPATVTYIMKEFLENPDKYSKILSKLDLYFVPLANPDGYEFSRRSDRLWRKNRSHKERGKCAGVDLNRNFSYKWGGKATSNNQCSENYRGPKPFSEPESRALRDFILARRRNIKMYLTFHNYGQMILYPWGYDRVDARDSAELHRMGTVGARAMGRHFKVGSAAKVIYEAAGTSFDWAKGGAGIKYSYTIELPDTGRYGFFLPASWINRTAREAARAVKAMAEDLIRNIR